MTRTVDLESLNRRTARRHVVSGSMFHREIAALDWRLHELDAVVDDFVLVESILTHSGKPNRPGRPDLDPRFAYAWGRLHVAVIEDPPRDPDPWIRESGQRAAIWSKGCAKLDLGDDTLVIVSDLDEVPFPEIVDRLAYSEFNEPIHVRPHWFNFDWSNYLGAWDHASIHFYTAGYLRRLFTNGRAGAFGYRSIPGLEVPGLHGWHASWFGDSDMILDKLASYSHAADKRDVVAAAEGREGIQRRRSSGGDIFGGRQRQEPRPRLPRHAGRMPGNTP
ncbi:MAG: hypothetical protein KDK07_25865 [Bauldia sp.]|nr:hypothetical protein [Bauldia sp.]